MNKKPAIILLLGIIISFTVPAVELLDQIIAVVEDDVILDRELSLEVSRVVARLQTNHVSMPPEPVLRKQVLERMIINKLQQQIAKRSGIQVSNDMLTASVADIARRNGLTISEFRQELSSQGIDFKSFEENIRHEIVVNQLRAREIGSRIKVTDREVEHYLETQGGINENNVQYHLGHILIALPEQASPSNIQQARQKAEKIIDDLHQGADFNQTAIAISDGGNALKGGDLGWRTLATIPTLFVDKVSKMTEGEIADLIRSPSGFHIIKLLAIKGLDKHLITKTRVRHILIKTNELIDDKEAQKRLQALRQRILDGDDFAALARSNSDDKGSALNGGNLDWVSPGDLVPVFETTMNQLAINQISEPVQTQFGWHIIQVMERQTQDNSIEYRKNKAREEIRKLKIEEETELWLRRLRDEAYVNINLDRL